MNSSVTYGPVLSRVHSDLKTRGNHLTKMASTFSCLFPRRIGWRIVNGGVRISSYALVHERHGQPENVVMYVLIYIQ